MTQEQPVSNSNCRITSTSCLLNHRCSFQISRTYYVTAGKRGFLDVTVKGNEHRFKSLYKWESVKPEIKIVPISNLNYHRIMLKKSFFHTEDDIYICVVYNPPIKSPITIALEQNDSKCFKIDI